MMLVGIVSDTHRDKEAITKITRVLKDCDLIIHAGDNFVDGIELHKAMKKPVFGVVGNCDFEAREEELELEIESFKFYITHGHLYKVKNTTEFLEKKAQQLGAKVVIYGHSHEANILLKDEILYINPGSPSKPRGKNVPTLAILKIKDGLLKPKIVEI